MEEHSANTALDRLLGPQGPEIGCQDCFDLLDEYVELELGGRDPDTRIPGLRSHLQGCPACREEHQALLELVGSAMPRPD
jgi:hypothetical protein